MVGLLAPKMSVLHVLPRLASWGNLHKRRSPNRELEDEYNRISNDIEAMADTNPGHRNRRKKISYWTEDEDNHRVIVILVIKKTVTVEKPLVSWQESWR